jgi:hypothetical protein
MRRDRLRDDNHEHNKHDDQHDDEHDSSDWGLLRDQRSGVKPSMRGIDSGRLPRATERPEHVARRRHGLLSGSLPPVWLLL